MHRLIWAMLGLCSFFASQTAATAQDCDLTHGELIFKKCAICHSINDGDTHITGPNLNGLLNRPVGKVEGFKFSRQLRKAEDIWTPELLDKFLESPMGMYPRTSMAFAGLKKEKDRAAVACYIFGKRSE